jgi:hypothetical protein
MPAPHNQARDHVGAGKNLGFVCLSLRNSDTQRLFDREFDSLDELIHPCLQALIFVD